ncbi:hypothetical protein OSB04_028984 [Centaurea solstitialis]|uniref:Transposase-associated domain-containing protein n=1 Tax=Centaurea solstitialis TaxID=347529 RepID=A0AA38SPA4_9ASTR|nr:hypothetical protein OSB04_028984 [Centaurea solstitialis]
MNFDNRAWIASRNCISEEYTLGLNKFLAVVEHHLGSNGRTLCPCNRCENTWLHGLSTIRAHILRYGMLEPYQRWIHHDESLSDEEEVDHFEDSSNNDEDDHTLRDAIVDEEERMFFNVDHSTENEVEDESDVSRGRFDKLIEKLNKEIYPGLGNLTLLQYVVKLMHIKVLNKWADKSVNMLLQFEQSILPSGYNLPTSYYEMKKILMEIGLGYHNIDVCNYDCALFYGEYANLLACHVCNHPRYIRNKVPFKGMRYFPLTPRLQ